MSSYITVIADITAREGNRPQLLEAMQTCILASRAESGCKSYELTTYVEDSNRFSFIERWESPEALQTHAASAHFLKLKAAIDEYSVDGAHLHVLKDAKSQ